VSGAITASTIDIGTGDTILKVDATGNLSIGHATPASAPFQVSTAGSLTTSDITITGLGSSGIDIGGTDSTSWHVDPDGNMWWGAASYAAASSKIANWGGAYLLYARIGGAAGAGAQTGKSWEINEAGLSNVSTVNSILGTDAIAIELNSYYGIFRAAGGRIIARGYPISGSNAALGDIRMGISQTTTDQPTWNLAGDIAMNKESGNIRFSVEQALTVDNGDVTINDGLTLTGNPTNSVGSYMLSRNAGGSLVWNGTALGGTYTWGASLSETNGTVNHDPYGYTAGDPYVGGYGSYIRTIWYDSEGHLTSIDTETEDTLTVYCDAPSTNPGSVPDRHVNDAISMNFGDSQDFKIQHSGTNSYLSQQGFGQLYVRHINSGHLYLQSGTGGSVYLQTGATNNTSSQTTALHCTGANVHVAGTLSKSSGSFDIVHPVVEGKRLRHSFIEGPQADLIYRGTAELGAAPTVINMDTEFGMTTGTWEALNCSPWSMVTASGKSLEWSFEGSSLTIQGDEGTVCSWMVIGERHDEHMKSVNCDIANSDGRVVLEYLDSENDNDNDGDPGGGISMGGNGGSLEGSPLGAPPAE